MIKPYHYLVAILLISSACSKPTETPPIGNIFGLEGEWYIKQVINSEYVNDTLIDSDTIYYTQNNKSRKYSTSRLYYLNNNSVLDSFNYKTSGSFINEYKNMPNETGSKTYFYDINNIRLSLKRDVETNSNGRRLKSRYEEECIRK